MRETGWSDGLLEAGFGDTEMAAVVGWPARIARMVEVEAAIGRALARCGLVPLAAADAIDDACAVGRVDLVDLAEQASRAATPVIPLVAALTQGADELAAAWLHHGATSQDIVDTAVVLQLRDALDLLDHRLEDAAKTCAALADAHRQSVMAGRTLGQQAVPITFGLRAARWLRALDRRREQLAWMRSRVLVVQLGGAAGTAAVYGEHAHDVVEALADALALAAPDLPWHAERDRIAELAGALATTAGAIEGIATDLVLLAQTEIGELREGAGNGPGSSAMPHKRNPTHATAARAAARLARGECQVLMEAAGANEYERAAGAWQAEWAALPSALVRLGGAVSRLAHALEGLEVDTDRMRANLGAHGGLTGSEALATALAAALGRPAAQALTTEVAAAAAAAGHPLLEAATADPRVTQHLDPDRLAHVLDPAAATASAVAGVERALAAHARTRQELGR
ncbi:lyase family protein [Egicoccus sp. AB-alg6-2]|uniref:lyase family protein n=1 Tax=Egicoccus sp. AB-alg6-2 TaxID=3242692 RepID=UPI00359D9721